MGPVERLSEYEPVRAEGMGRNLLAWALIAALLCAPPIFFAWFAQYVIDRDPFVYGQLAKEVLAGRRLYTESWQDKPPLAVVAYLLPQLVAPRSSAALAWFGGLCVAATAALYMYAFRHCLVAVFAVGFFVTLFPLTAWDCYAWPSTEIFANGFVAGDLLVALRIFRRRTFSLAECLGAGALACLAFHVRQTALLCVVVPGLAVLMADRAVAEKLRALGAIVGGGLLAWLPILGFVYRIGDLRMYAWTVFVYPRAFAQSGSSAKLFDLLDFWWQGPLPFLLLLFMGVAMRTRRDVLFVVAIAAVGLCTAISPMRYHMHYWSSSFPYLALITGMGMERLSATLPQVAWSMTAALGLVCVPAIATQMSEAVTYDRYQTFADIAQAADNLAPERATLFVCGKMPCEAIQFASKLAPANVFEWTFQFAPGWVENLPLPFDQIVEQYLEFPPDVVVVLRTLAAQANANPNTDELSNEVRLLRALLKRHEYRIMREMSGYVLAVRANR